MIINLSVLQFLKIFYNKHLFILYLNEEMTSAEYFFDEVFDFLLLAIITFNCVNSTIALVRETVVLKRFLGPVH